MRETISVFCPHCRQYTSIRIGKVFTPNSLGSSTADAVSNNDKGETWWIGFCNFCEGAMLVGKKGTSIYPNPGPAPSDPRIPQEIKDDFDEAKVCFSVDCHRACCVISRRAIQAACIKMGGHGDNLYDQIKDLAERRIITEDLSEFAHNIRTLGRDAAHPEIGPVGKEDSADCLFLTEQFLNIIFVAPAIAADLKKKRSGKS